MTASPFAIRAVVEGFYGTFYTVAERNDLLRFLAQHGYNHYFYAPKNDIFHRDRWREPYPPDMMAGFAATVALAQEAGIAFSYAIAPGLTMCYADEGEWEILTAKLLAFYRLGVRSFGLFLDDIPPAFHCAVDRARYASYGAAHADLCNRLHRWLVALDLTCTLTMCPTHYHGLPPFDPYLHELGAALDPAVELFYTGPQVCSTVIAAEDVAAFAAVVRRPPILWDNFPVNDGEMAAEMHIGPIRGRDPRLGEVSRGVAVNPMNQAEASRVPLLTWADFLADPVTYEPERSWERALRAVGGEAALPALRRFAENSLYSCLSREEAAPLWERVAAALDALRRGEPPATSRAVGTLESYLLELEEGSFFLKYRTPNRALRDELLPWLEAMDHWRRVGQQALTLLHAHERDEPCDPALRRMEALLAQARAHPKRWGGAALAALAEYVLEATSRRAVEGATRADPLD